VRVGDVGIENDRDDLEEVVLLDEQAGHGADYASSCDVPSTRPCGSRFMRSAGCAARGCRPAAAFAKVHLKREMGGSASALLTRSADYR
jgi:hypothetical protein